MELLEKSISFLSGGDGDDRKQSAEPKGTDEEEHFGRMVADTLNRFSPYQRMVAEKRIIDVLFDVEYAGFQQNQQSQEMLENSHRLSQQPSRIFSIQPNYQQTNSYSNTPCPLLSLSNLASTSYSCQ